MNFNDYQKLAATTAAYPNIGDNFIYPSLGLAGEVGELINKIKKIIRDKGGVLDEETRTDLKKELGDVLWYAAQLSTELKLNLEDVAEENIKKLASRAQRGALHGTGDNR
jgi:NTP pyrophosphatase (non-canonical NTP hydrolase)